MTIIKFLAAGILNTVIGLSIIYAAMYYLKIDVALANLIGYFIAIIIGFFINKHWTFNDKAKFVSSFSRYIVVIVTAYLVNLGIVIFSIYFLSINPYFAQLMGIVPYTAIGYLGCKLFAFTDPIAKRPTFDLIEQKNCLINKPVKLAIVVPCYNEEEVLPETNKRLLALKESIQDKGIITASSAIYYVDDGSKDKTWKIITDFNAANASVHGIKLSKNQGHQNALLAGLFNAEADVIVSIDADLQDDINAIVEMLNLYKHGFEIVYGVRASRNSDAFFKRFSAQMYYRLLKLMNVELTYNHADYRLMSKRVVNCLKSYKEVNLFLRGIIPLLGFRSATVFYERKVRFAGESKYPLRKMLALAANGITSFSVTPLRMITWLGFLVSLSSIVVTIWVIFGKYVIYNTIPGWASIILSIYFLGGVQLIGIGILGEYIGRIYMETKQRPLYFIDEII